MPRRDPLRIRRETLDDGLVLARQDAPPGALSVALTYIGPAGSAYDPAPLRGSALLAGELAVVAAGARDRRALARHLDSIGGSLSDHPSPECVELTASGPAERWPALLDVLADAVLRPRFDPEDVARGRRQIRERQLRQHTQPDLRAELELLRTVYPSGHPYAQSGMGDRRTVARLDGTALHQFHRDHYTVDGAAIVVTGNMSDRELRRAVERRFRGLGLPKAPTRPPLPRRRRDRGGRRDVTLPGRAQTEIRVGLAALPRNDPRFAALFLANEVLGGQVLLSRLFQRVREREGLAYNASSDLEAMGWGGYWEAQAGTGPERADLVERLVLAEFTGLRERGIPPGVLDRIRESTIGSIALEVETTQGAHDLAVTSAYYDFPPDYYARWPTELRAIRPRAIRDAVAEVMAPGSLSVVRVGPASPATNSS